MSDDARLRREGRLRLGFLTNVPFTSEAGGVRRGLEEAIATFEYAESIGFDTGWVRQRHFDNCLASPITLLASVSQRTERIRLGTRTARRQPAPARALRRVRRDPPGRGAGRA